MRNNGKQILRRYNHWRRNKIISLSNTVAGILSDKGVKVVSSQDCTADPCSCTGCSAWD